MLEKNSLIPFYKNVLSWNKVAGNDLKNGNLINLYDNLVDEESKEIFHAVDTNDKVEFLDGLVDSMVVGSYLYALVNQTNFDNYIEGLEEVDVIESIESLKVIISSKQATKEIPLILTYLENISYSVSDDIDVVGACNEVMDSNWSKFPLVSEVEPEEEVLYIEGQGRYKGVTYAKVKDDEGNFRYVFRNDAGKVVKPSTFKEPSLESFIPENWNFI